jgi:hypothetical protein
VTNLDSDSKHNSSPAPHPPPSKSRCGRASGDGTVTDPSTYANLSVAFSKPEPAYITVYAQRGLKNHDGRSQGRQSGLRFGRSQEARSQGRPKKYITAKAAVDAPDLWGEIKGRTPPGSAHAEDVAAYRNEKSIKKMLAAGITYPANSIIRVRGSFNGDEAKQQCLSSTVTSKIDPAYNPVFFSLGVGHGGLSVCLTDRRLV